MKEEERAPDRKLGLHGETVTDELQNKAFSSCYLAGKHFTTPIAPLMTISVLFFKSIQMFHFCCFSKDGFSDLLKELQAFFILSH